MKRKTAFAPTFAFALSAALLTGCSRENGLINNSDMSETVSDMLTQVSETGDDALFTLGGETEAAVTESEADSAQEIMTEYSAEGVTYRFLDYGSLDPDGEDNGSPYGNQFYKDGIFCITYRMSPPEYYPGGMRFQMRFYSTAENKFLAAVDIPTGWIISEKLTETDSGIFCRYALTRYLYDEAGNVTGSEQAVLTVRNDFSSDTTEGCTAKDRSVSVCGHNIAEWERDIIDADSGDILVEGYDGTSEYDLYITSQRYEFPIDENRFVYYTAGYERIPGFGIYDFSTGTATDVPNSQNLVPLGINGGRIYSLQTEWDSFGHDLTLYVTDTETLETELFAENPFSSEISYYADYHMPESGSFIAMAYQPDDENIPAQLYIIDPDTKEYTVCDIPDEFRDCGFSQADGSAYIMSDRDGKALIIEIEV